MYYDAPFSILTYRRCVVRSCFITVLAEHGRCLAAWAVRVEEHVGHVRALVATAFLVLELIAPRIKVLIEVAAVEHSFEVASLLNVPS